MKNSYYICNEILFILFIYLWITAYLPEPEWETKIKITCLQLPRKLAEAVGRKGKCFWIPF